MNGGSGTGLSELGPFPVSRTQQVARAFHRLSSVKAGPRTVVCIGRLAADAVMIGEGDPSVVGLCDRSLRIHGASGTRPYTTFDLSLTYRSGRTRHFAVHRDAALVPSDDGRRLPPHWVALERRAFEAGHEVALLTDVEIARHAQRIRNWRRLLPFVLEAHRDPHPAVADALVERLGDHEDLTLDEMASQVSSEHSRYVLPEVARLLHGGSCTAELDTKALTRATRVSLRNVDYATG